VIPISSKSASCYCQCLQKDKNYSGNMDGYRNECISKGASGWGHTGSDSKGYVAKRSWFTERKSLEANSHQFLTSKPTAQGLLFSPVLRAAFCVLGFILRLALIIQKCLPPDCTATQALVHIQRERKSTFVIPLPQMSWQAHWLSHGRSFDRSPQDTITVIRRWTVI
jgi:hypothetical protein